MKKNSLILLLLFFFFFSLAQRPQHCDVPIPDHVFRQKLKSVNLQTTEERKLQVANAIAVNNCLSTEQVKAIATLFIDDFNRLDFAKRAWITTVDKNNFYFVYDDFAYFSTVFMLHDYIKARESHPTDYLPPYIPTVSLNFPALDYPAYENYRGPSNCTYPIRDDEFNRLAMQLANSTSEASRMLFLRQIAQNNCLSVSQIMKFASMLASEPDRLSFFKTDNLSVFDLNNLPFGVQLFAHIPNKAAFNDYISRYSPGPFPAVLPPCSVNEGDFSQIKETIRKERFNSTKLTLAKQIIRSKKCFTVWQITEMVKLFTFGDSQLELAKFAFDYTIDQENYYRVAEAFTFSSGKEDLMKFLETKN